MADGDLDFAVVAGINRYPGLSNLSGPENDAIEFKKWLLDPTGGNLKPDQVTTILSSQYPVAATVSESHPGQSELRKALRNLQEIGNKAGGKAGRRLYLFFAGHGFTAQGNEPVLLTADADRDNVGLNIPARAYAEWFRSSAFFDEIVLFMDCCREHYPVVGAPIPWPPRRAASGESKFRFYAFAASPGEYARERVFNGQVRGIFSVALLYGLRNAPRSPGTNRITGTSLRKFLFSYVRSLVQDGESTESADPVFEYDECWDLEFGFSQTSASMVEMVDVRIDITPSHRGRPLMIVQGTKQLARTEKASESWNLRLPIGYFKIAEEMTQTAGLLFEVQGGEAHVTF